MSMPRSCHCSKNFVQPVVQQLCVEHVQGTDIATAEQTHAAGGDSAHQVFAVVKINLKTSAQDVIKRLLPQHACAALFVQLIVVPLCCLVL